MKSTTIVYYITVLIILVFFTITRCARAEMITEFGGGWKVPATTSLWLHPDCTTGEVPTYLRNDPNSPFYGRVRASCGGDNPMFYGWPVAWEKQLKRGHRIRIGWFHISHWFDGGNARLGGDKHEIHLDCICTSYTFRWSQLSKRR